MISFNNMTQSIYRCLGNRFNIAKEPGFIRKYHSEIAKATLIGPITFEFIKIIYLKAFESKKELKNNTFSVENIKNNFFEILKQDKVAIATSLFVGALFVSFKETPSVVGLGYTAILASHIFKTVQEYKKESNAGFIKHLFASFATLSTLGTMKAGIYAFRWHHMSYGLLSMLSNLKSFSFFGACMTLDSMLYWIRPLKDNYDFSNIFVDHLSSYILQVGGLSLYEISASSVKKSHLSH